MAVAEGLLLFFGSRFFSGWCCWVFNLRLLDESSSPGGSSTDWQKDNSLEHQKDLGLSQGHCSICGSFACISCHSHCRGPSMEPPCVAEPAPQRMADLGRELGQTYLTSWKFNFHTRQWQYSPSLCNRLRGGLNELRYIECLALRVVALKKYQRLSCLSAVMRGHGEGHFRTFKDA